MQDNADNIAKLIQGKENEKKPWEKPVSSPLLTTRKIQRMHHNLVYYYPMLTPLLFFKTTKITHTKNRHFSAMVNSTHLRRDRMLINIRPYRTKSATNHNFDMSTLILFISLDGAVSVITRSAYSNFINPSNT